MISKSIDFAALETALGHHFANRALLEQALTHTSYARELESQSATSNPNAVEFDNEQMEFLGDAVLSFVVSQELFRRFPEYQEGELSKLRAHVVSARHLAQPARELGIGQFLRLGRGEERSGGRNKNALLVNALEAVIAAIYLDANLEAAQRLILSNILEPALDELQSAGDKVLPVLDFKSALQEALHRAGRPQPRYVLVKEEGPDHRKTFTMEVRLAASGEAEAYLCRGAGGTKKLAEQEAARTAWEYLQSLKKDEPIEGCDPTDTPVPS